MFRYKLTIVSLGLILHFAFTACETVPDSNSVQEPFEGQPASFIARPRFGKPLFRPLGRVLLHWNAIDGAKGYEIQMSDSQEFLFIEKSWIVRGLELEIPLGSEEGRWFRIRSFKADMQSEWSAALKATLPDQ